MNETAGDATDVTTVRTPRQLQSYANVNKWGLLKTDVDFYSVGFATLWVNKVSNKQTNKRTHHTHIFLFRFYF